MVCKACQDILLRQADLCWEYKPRKSGAFFLRRAGLWHAFKPRKSGAFFIHHRDFESLRKAAEDEKCLFCYNLWTQLGPETCRLAIEYESTLEHHTTSLDDYISHAMVTDHSRKTKISGIFSSFGGSAKARPKESGPWRLYLTVPNRKLKKFTERHVVAFYELCESRDTSTIPHSERLTSSSTHLPNSKLIASRWLEQCSAKHRACNEDLGRDGWNPTRLLDLRSPSDGEIYLLDQTSSMEPLTYVTLSHRWGQASFLELNKTTEARLKRGFSLSELPQAFRDAIEVTRTLGYRFLWIDSLCIKQDREDTADWFREASLMHRVYQHGHFNISATGCENSWESLFRSRDHTATGFTEVDFLVGEAGAAPTQCMAWQTSFWRDNVDETSLNKRGWVVQERILSKRVLHFGAKQLLWECRELNACESFPYGLPRELVAVNIKRLEPYVPAEDQSDPLQRAQAQRYWAHYIWYGIVSSYSSCSLTKHMDKLPAIMGVAKQFQSLLNDNYVAGMWRKYLVGELGWTAKSYAQGRPAMYRAPTWSWASIDAPVYPGAPSDQGLRLAIKDISLDYATEDEFGPLLKGHIHLEGILRPAEFRHSPDGVVAHYRSFVVYLPTTSAFNANTPPTDHSPHGRLASTVYFDVDPITLRSDVMKLFCMELRDDELRDEPGRVSSTLSLLILRCEDKTAAIYSRMGILKYSGRARELLLKDTKRVRDLPCVSWSAQTKLHTICVI